MQDLSRIFFLEFDDVANHVAISYDHCAFLSERDARKRRRVHSREFLHANYGRLGFIGCRRRLGRWWYCNCR